MSSLFEELNQAQNSRDERNFRENWFQFAHFTNGKAQVQEEMLLNQHYWEEADQNLIFFISDLLL